MYLHVCIILGARYRDPTPCPFTPEILLRGKFAPLSRANETFTITGLLYLFSPSSAGNDVTRRVCRHVLVTDADTVDLIKRNWVDVKEDDNRETTTTTKQTVEDDDDVDNDVKYLLFIRVSALLRARTR